MSKKFTKYTGIKWCSKAEQWKASLRFEGEDIIFGFSSTDIGAAKLRDIRIISLGMPVSKLQVLKPAL